MLKDVNLFGLAAAVVNIIGWGIYLSLQKQKKVQSNPVAWGLSLLIVVVGAYTFHSITSSISSSLMYMTGAVACLLAFINSFDGDYHLSKSEYVTGLFALCVLPLAIIKPNMANYVLAGYYLLTYSIFLTGVITGDTIESALPWFVWSLAALCLIASQLGKPIENFILPVTNLICWLSIGLANKKNWKQSTSLKLNTP